MQKPFFDKINEIERLINEGPSKVSFIKDILPLLSEKSSIYHFYEIIEDPKWISNLDGANQFNDVPAQIMDSEKIEIAPPIWPQSRFLARISEKDPKIVYDVILRIPTTDNEHIHSDFLKAACAMPTNLAANLAIKEAEWIRSKASLFFRLPELAGELISKLAKGGEVDSALALTESIFEILPEAKEIPEDWDDEFKQIVSSQNPKARFDTWQYENVLKKCIPDLISVAKIDALILFCEQLENAIRIKNAGRGREEESEDYSYIWRPAIEENEQNRPEDLTGILISAVRDAAELLMDTDGEKVLELIEGREFKVFKRIGLHLRRKWPDIDKEKMELLILDQKFVRDNHYRHEMYHLLKEQFDKLPPKLQTVYLTMIEKEVDPTIWAKGYKNVHKKKPDQEEIDRYKKSIKYKLLLPIEVHLKDKWLEMFDELKNIFGEETHPDFAYKRGTTWIGPTSPKSVDELRSMSIDELILFLKDWEPTGEPMSPSREGLGRIISSLVKENPDRFANEAIKFNVVNPPYIEGIISGFRDAIKDNKTYRWGQIIELCQWVVSQDRDLIPNYQSEYPNNPGWGWGRKSIADLIENGFQSITMEFTIDLREKVWSILAPLTEDKEPDEEHEKEYGGSNMDPVTLSINTVRGEAMHAVMQYALWSRRDIDKSPNAEERIQKGFEEMPEVKEVLDKHLDLEVEKTLTIRSVYGKWFPWLVLLDSEWSKKNVKNIFPYDEKQIKYFDAAWGGYVEFCSPYDNVLPYLEKEYAFAIDQLGHEKDRSKTVSDPEEQLADHLMTYYWRGKLVYDDDGLIAKFFEKASAKLRGHALFFIGRSVRNTKVEIKQEILERLQTLWERRITAAITLENPEDFQEEISWFGWWFTSGKFETSWSFTQLKEVLKCNITMDDMHRLVERLGELKEEYLPDVIECLSQIVENAKSGYVFHLKNDEVREILKCGLESDNKSVSDKAEETVHRLGAMGFLEYRDMLKG